MACDRGPKGDVRTSTFVADGTSIAFRFCSCDLRGSSDKFSDGFDEVRGREIRENDLI